MAVKPESLLNESDEVLKSIYKILNGWGWPEILGDKPDGWDLMPNYRKPWMDENMKTRNDIIRPYMDVIKTRIDHRDVYPIKGRVEVREGGGRVRTMERMREHIQIFHELWKEDPQFRMRCHFAHLSLFLSVVVLVMALLVLHYMSK